MPAAQDINPQTGKAYAIRPDGIWDDNYFARTFGGASPLAGNNTSPVSTSSVLDSAKQVRQFNIDSNQPAIQSLEASKSPLQDRYKNLLDTIKGNQTVAENRQTVTTNNELGRRGISGDSGIAEQEITNAVNPITQAFTGQYKDASAQQGIDLSAIQNAIAQLQSGNPESSISSAIGVGGQEQQARQFAQSLAQQKAISDATIAQASKTSPITLGEGQTVYDPTTGKAVYTAPKTYKPESSGGGIDLSGIIAALNGGNKSTTPSSFKAL